MFTLGDIAQRFSLELKGDAATLIDGVCTLTPGQPGRIGFLANPKYRSALSDTVASAVIVGKRDSDALSGAGLVAKDPYRAFAQVAGLFDTSRTFQPGIHPSASVAPDAELAEGVHVGAQAVIESGARIGAHAFIGPGCIVGAGATLGARSRLVARVWLYAGVTVGERCQIEPGAVIGSRGFGNVMGPQGWEEVPQLGSVVIGNDVEIGANTTIDRGAIDDTVIGNGVRLDNQIQIAHNCRIGDHTAIAGCTGVAGSTTIGKRCMIGGAAVINGHIEITDGVIVLGMSMVTHSLTERGIYGSGTPAAPAREWRKSVARVRRLDVLNERVQKIEQCLDIKTQEERDDGNEL